MHNSYHLLQVSTYDSRGGAARVALELHRAFVARGVDARLAVGKKFELEDESILSMQNDEHRRVVSRFLIKKAEKLESSGLRGGWRTAKLLRKIAEPKRSWNISRGMEDFDFPATKHLLDLHPQADLIHCHNLHGDFFDLRQLPSLSHRIPVALTLHDAWLLSGHCAHSIDCERWKEGCGDCPDLNLYPKVQKDRTHANWLRKREIYRGSQLYVVTPSRWLMDKAQASILSQAILDHRIIPNGVDLSLFHRVDKAQAKKELRLTPDRFVALVSGSVFRENPAADLELLKQVLSRVNMEERALCLILGSSLPDENMRSWEIRCLPFVQDRKSVAHYFQAADVLLHPSKADTFPMSVLEALACGVPVIATSVGGIPEQIRGLTEISAPGRSPRYGSDEATGALIAPGDNAGFGKALELLMKNDVLRNAMAQNAAVDAAQRFSLQKMTDAYLSLHKEILSKQTV